jgi:hypothetical protein
MPESKELSGRELNFAIAERVMGWERGKRYGNGNGEWIIPDWKQVLPLTWSRTPQFCESIEAAMQIVEKLRERGVWTQIQTFIHTTQVRVEMGVPSSECQEWGATAAEAICKCALKAVAKFALTVDNAAALSAMEQQK